jgi:hypothetical protein
MTRMETTQKHNLIPKFVSLGRNQKRRVPERTGSWEPNKGIWPSRSESSLTSLPRHQSNSVHRRVSFSYLQVVFSFPPRCSYQLHRSTGKPDWKGKGIYLAGELERGPQIARPPKLMPRKDDGRWLARRRGCFRCKCWHSSHLHCYPR